MTVLSPITSYYLRRMINHYRNRLKFVAAPNAALEADALADLNAVVISLYLEEEAVYEVANKLETLVQMHKHLDDQHLQHAKVRINIEQEILWLLGFKVLEH